MREQAKKWIGLFEKGRKAFLRKKDPNEPSFIKDFTSGGQLTMHSIRMFGQALHSLVWFGVMIFGLLLMLLFFLQTEPFDRYLVVEALIAYCEGILSGRGATHWLQDENHEWVEVLALELLSHPRTVMSLEVCAEALKDASLQALWGALGSWLILGGYFCFRGRKGRTPTHFTGQTRVKPEDFRKRLEQADKASSFKIAGVPLLKGAEVQHLLLTGTTGTGKTLCLEELMDQIRAQGQRAIVYDIEGNFTAHYYREGKDILLNPLDARCPPWNIWQEGDKAADFEAIAASLMPLHLAGTDPFWIHSARTIFSCAAQRLQVQNKRSMQDLLFPLFSEHLGSLSTLVEGSVAESLVSDKNEKTALSIKATLSTYCKALMYLHDQATPSFEYELRSMSDLSETSPLKKGTLYVSLEKGLIQYCVLGRDNKTIKGQIKAEDLGDGIKMPTRNDLQQFESIKKSILDLSAKRGHIPLFSIRDWLQAEDQDSCLFIATDAQKVEALKPLISVWLDVAAKSILSLKPSDTRRLWFFLDELPSLHRLPNLMNALARARKYGGCFVAAIQDIHQIRGIYGQHESETFMSLFNTNLCYRTKCPQTAVWMSKIMGGLEFMEKKEGYSYGAHETRDSVSVQPERRREAVVKESELLELNDCEAFLKLPGDWPVTYLKFEPQARKELAPALLEREAKELLLFDQRQASEDVEGAPKEDAQKPEEKPCGPAKKSTFVKKPLIQSLGEGLREVAYLDER